MPSCRTNSAATALLGSATVARPYIALRESAGLMPQPKTQRVQSTYIVECRVSILGITTMILSPITVPRTFWEMHRRRRMGRAFPGIVTSRPMRSDPESSNTLQSRISIKEYVLSQNAKVLAIYKRFRSLSLREYSLAQTMKVPVI